MSSDMPPQSLVDDDVFFEEGDRDTGRQGREARKTRRRSFIKKAAKVFVGVIAAGSALWLVAYMMSMAKGKKSKSSSASGSSSNDQVQASSASPCGIKKLLKMIGKSEEVDAPRPVNPAVMILDPNGVIDNSQVTVYRQG